MAKPTQVKSPDQIANQINCLKSVVAHQFETTTAPSGVRGAEGPSTFDPCLSDDDVAFRKHGGNVYVWDGDYWDIINA